MQKTKGCIAKKPLLIGSLLADATDVGISLFPLLEEALSLERQVFLFTGDENVEERLNGMKEKRIISL